MIHSLAELDTFPGRRPKDFVEVHGVVAGFGLHPERLKEKEPEIIALLEELPDEFKTIGGGGHSFLNLCNDKHGTQWADTHKTCDALLCLGIAIGKAEILMPRELWGALPGGMPYISIL